MAAEVPAMNMDEGTQAEEAEDEVADAAEHEDLPEMLELIDAAEEVGDDVESLTTIVRNIGRRIRATPGDRDLLNDFEGLAHICKALATPAHNWKGDAMIAFCRAMPDICRTSAVNRGSLRDEGFVVAAVELLRSAIADGEEAAAVSASLALASLCTSSDGNKRAAAQLQSPERIVEIAEGDALGDVPQSSKPGALILLVDALARFPESNVLQTEAVACLRALLTDDDPRKGAGKSAAVENREVATSDEGFPFYGVTVERALATVADSEKPLIKLHEQALLLLRELSRRPDRIEALAIGAKLLARVKKSVMAEDARVVRAALGVLQNFAAHEEVRDDLTIMSDGARDCMVAVKKNLKTPAVCEQGFGLFANLTMRKSPVSAKLCEGEPSLITLALPVLRAHQDRPDVMRSTIHTLRNVASQEESVIKEIKETDIFEEVRKVVKQHEQDSRWKSAVDISRQFLREHRQDEGMEKKAQYNKFY